MQKIINRTLLLIIISLIGLLAYRTFKIPNITKAQIDTIELIPNQQNVISNENLEERVQLIIKDYLLNNPNLIVEALEKLQKRKTQEIENKIGNYLRDNIHLLEQSDGLAMGNENADVTIIAFYDYNCSFCKKANDALNELIQKDNNVRVILKPLPILGEQSNWVAKIAVAASQGAVGQFLKVHNSLMHLKYITKEATEVILTENNLDLQNMENLAESESVKKILDRNFEFASHLRIQGAPAFIIGQKLIPGFLSVTQLEDLIAQVRKQNTTH